MTIVGTTPSRLIFLYKETDFHTSSDNPLQYEGLLTLQGRFWTLNMKERDLIMVKAFSWRAHTGALH